MADLTQRIHCPLSCNARMAWAVRRQKRWGKVLHNCTIQACCSQGLDVLLSMDGA